MSSAHLFEDFSQGNKLDRSRVKSQDDALEGYESGYQAGWDDAIKAHQDAQTHLSSTLSQNLEQIEFTLIEAQTQLLSTIKPVLEEIMKTLLPGLLSEGLRALVVEEIETLLKTNVAKDISLVVSEQDEMTVAAFLNSSRNLSDISLVAKETLTEGQAYVSCATLQRKIDVTQAISDIQSRVDSFLNQPELEQTVAR
ncbi:flagellar assembly protein FliH [Planktotalea frisia]|jgi:flagellar assembly protein FliH|uniref:Flagellar assembly protein H n=2 Tax=Planktotalea frisia TaxID=696762 RepID=A0A1L9NT96_9RHOB|nr:hypothetical protein [Planktotalea frisia]OJI92487.1 hypothetical protein PFRI_32720 [Planktotalea frisia]PZX24008.1 flagellar assembly protein FliH [Planktotalea frisia]